MCRNAMMTLPKNRRAYLQVNFLLFGTVFVISFGVFFFLVPYWSSLFSRIADKQYLSISIEFLLFAVVLSLLLALWNFLHKHLPFRYDNERIEKSGLTGKIKTLNWSEITRIKYNEEMIEGVLEPLYYGTEFSSVKLIGGGTVFNLYRSQFTSAGAMILFLEKHIANKSLFDEKFHEIDKYRRSADEDFGLNDEWYFPHLKLFSSKIWTVVAMLEISAAIAFIVLSYAFLHQFSNSSPRIAGYLAVPYFIFLGGPIFFGILAHAWRTYDFRPHKGKGIE